MQDEHGNSIIQLNKNLKSQRSIHVIAGGDYTFRASGRNFKVSADMYYKKLDNLNPYTVDNVKIRYYGENCAQGHAMGLDVKFFGEFVPGVRTPGSELLPNESGAKHPRERICTDA